MSYRTNKDYYEMYTTRSPPETTGIRPPRGDSSQHYNKFKTSVVKPERFNEPLYHDVEKFGPYKYEKPTRFNEALYHDLHEPVAQKQIVKAPLPTPPVPVTPSNTGPFQIKWEYVEGNLSDPKIWGPAFWLTLHNGAYSYPVHASGIVIDKMKGFIDGIPYMIVCKNCANHASAFIDMHRDKMDDICSGQNNLFNFFVDLHNYVNKRYNKPEMTYDQARQLFSKKAKVTKMSYS